MPIKDAINYAKNAVFSKTDKEFAQIAVEEYVQKRKNGLSVYTNASGLHDSINAAIAATKAANHYINPTTKKAADDLVTELKQAMTTWENSVREDLTVNSNHKLEAIKKNQSNYDNTFAETCQGIVNKYKNKIMHDPSFWEQVKGAINDFSRACTGYKVFSVKLSPISSEAKNNDPSPEADIEKNMEDIQDYRPHR